MKTVKIDKVQLLGIVTANRDKHRSLFEKAFEGYRQECIRVLTQNLESLKSGKRVKVLIYEVAPEDHTEDYDSLIRMLNMSVEATVELTHHEFLQYVEDDWQWRHNWNSTNSKYLPQEDQ